METAQLLFRAPKRKRIPEFLDKVQSYLAALSKNGQIISPYTVAKVRDGYLVTASLPERNALADRFANKWVRKGLRDLAAIGVARPRVTHLGTEPDNRAPCRCRKPPFLILFTTCLHAEPPVRCGACFGPVALYKLPPTDGVESYQDVLRWEDIYSTVDSLFIATGPGELFAHQQLSRVESELSADGRELARNLEKRTRVPVYYYLSKYFGRSDRAERKRRCPSCGKPWLRDEPLHRIFDFQCERCRLLSNVAFAVRPFRESRGSR